MFVDGIAPICLFSLHDGTVGSCYSKSVYHLLSE